MKPMNLFDMYLSIAGLGISILILSYWSIKKSRKAQEKEYQQLLSSVKNCDEIQDWYPLYVEMRVFLSNCNHPNKLVWRKELDEASQRTMTWLDKKFPQSI
jgi:hypothetical protein